MSRWDLLINLWSVGRPIEAGLFIVTSLKKLALYWCVCSSSIELEWESSHGIGDKASFKEDDRANFSVQHFSKSVFVLFATVPLAKGKSKFIPYSRSKDAIVIDGGGVMKSHRKGRWKFCSNICSWLPLLSLLCLELYSEWSHSQINMTIHSQSSILHSKSKRTMRIKVIRWLWLKEIILGY